MSCVIPTPPAWPIIGHTLSFDLEVPIRTLQQWGNQFGEIFELNFIRTISHFIMESTTAHILTLSVSTEGKAVVVNTVELMNDCSNDRKFTKTMKGPIREIRELGRDALFTVMSRLMYLFAL